MKLKLNALIAAVAVLAAGGAHAALEKMESGSSSLTLLAYDRTGSATGSFLADLNFDLNAFLPTAATASQTIVWNFNANTITVNGVLQTGSTIGWNSPFSAFTSSVQTSETRWAVIAGDSVNQRFLTTGTPTAGNLADTGTTRQTNSSTASMVFADNFYLSNIANAANNTLQTFDAGASKSASSDPSYFAVNNANGFGTNGNWNNALKWNAALANNTSSKFYYLNNVPRGGTGDVAEITTYGNPDVIAPGVATTNFSTFAYDQTAGTLTWTGVAAPIPEPGTYAMLLAGLAAVGFVARRRRV